MAASGLVGRVAEADGADGVGWFGGGHGAGGERPVAVSVLSRADGRSAGAAVLLPGGRLLTCAHVVNSALGTDLLAARDPGPEPVRVRVHCPGGPLERVARTAVWVPPEPGGGLEWSGDLAVLEVAEALPPRGRPPRWTAMAEGQSVRAWHGGGEAATLAAVRVVWCDGRFGYLDGESATGAGIQAGYSGGPLWSGERRAVVGLVAGHLRAPSGPYSPDHVARRSWGIPWQRIRAELARVGAGHMLDGVEEDGPAASGAGDPCAPALAGILGRALADRAGRADRARTVAERCGLGFPDDGSAPTVDEFARLLLTHRRALPALSGLLRPLDPGAADELLAVGRRAAVPRLLAPQEYEGLLASVGSLPAATAARFPSVVRAALPLAALPARLLTGPEWAGEARARAARVGELVDRLEGLHGDSEPVPNGTSLVPGLLRVVEYLAAVCPPEGAERLRAWNASVAARLGVRASALAERRVDARGWADGPGSAPRVLVRLVTRGERYLMRVWCDEGAGPRRVSDDEERERDAAEAAAEIQAVLQPLHRAATGGALPVIELLVDREGLELPVDQWEWPGPGGLLPGVVGAEYPVVVNCPELLGRGQERFRAQWRERWRRLDEGGAVHVGPATGDARAVYGLLLERLDAARVTVDDVPSRLRTEIVQVCLAMGVPVVLWERTGSAWAHVADNVAGAAARRLPEEVRTYRARSLHQREVFAGRPVLAWADADRPAPGLELADPTEGVR